MASNITGEAPPPLDAMYAEYLPEEPRVVTKTKKKLTVAQKNALKRKEQQEFKILEMRDQLRREYEMSKKTARKYQEHWENMCREIRLKDMKKELEDWEQQVRRLLKQKDDKIELILDEIATTKEIHKKQFSSQLQMMDYLMDIWKTFKQTSRLLYENEASEIVHDFYREVENRAKVENSMTLNCESVANATALIAEQELLTDYKIFLDKRDDRVNTEIEKRYRLRDAIIQKMKDLRKQLLEFINSLFNVSLDVKKYERINTLMERQRNFQNESEKFNSMEARSSRIYADLQRLLAREEKVAKRKIDDLKLEHAYFLQIRKSIADEMELNREQTHEKLKIVTSESFKVIKEYQKLLKFGELLLSLAANCRKFQTQSEKVVPWGDFQEPKNEIDAEYEPFKLKVIDLKDHVDISETELQTSSQLMKHFWRRQAIVEAEVVLLEEKKRQLQKENQTYISRIKRLSKTTNADDLKVSLRVESALEPDF